MADTQRHCACGLGVRVHIHVSVYVSANVTYAQQRTSNSYSLAHFPQLFRAPMTLSGVVDYRHHALRRAPPSLVDQVQRIARGRQAPH